MTTRTDKREKFLGGTEQFKNHKHWPAGHKLPERDCNLMARVYFHLSTYMTEVQQGGSTKTVRQLFMACFGLSEHRYLKFEEAVEQAENGECFSNTAVGRRNKQTIADGIGEEARTDLKVFVAKAGETGQPVTIEKCQNFMKDAHQLDLKRETTRRFMKETLKLTRVKIASFGTSVDSARIHVLIDKYLELKAKYADSLQTGEMVEVWSDESYVHENYAVSSMWIDSQAPKAVFNSPECKGSRLILIHWATKEGWIDAGKRVWICTKKDSENPDYHKNVAHDAWLEVFEEVCIHGHKNGKRYLFCIDNASYHKTKEVDETMLTHFEGRGLATAKKEHLESFLKANQISYPTKAKKDALKELVKEHYKGPRPKSVTIAEKYGHVVLFTPPYWPDFQPIEKAWAIAKGFVARNRQEKSYNVHATKKLILEGFDQVTPEIWAKLTRNTHEFEESMRVRRKRQKEGLDPEFDSTDMIVAQTGSVIRLIDTEADETM